MRKFTLEAWSNPKIKKDVVAKEIKPCEIIIEKTNLESLKLSPNSKSKIRNNNTYKTRPCEIKLGRLDLDDLILSPNSISIKNTPSDPNTQSQNNNRTRTSNRTKFKNPSYYAEEWIT